MHIRSCRHEGMNRWEKHHPSKALRICGSLGQDNGQSAGTTWPSWHCHGSAAPAQDTMLKALQPCRSQTTNWQGKCQDISSNWLHQAVIIMSCLTGIDWEEQSQQPLAMHQLWGTQFGNIHEPVPPTTDLGDAKLNATSRAVCSAGPLDCISQNLDQRMQSIFHHSLYLHQGARFVNYALWIDKSPSPIPGIHYDDPWQYIAQCAIRNLGNIRIYSTNKREHEAQVQIVPERLCKLGLNCRADECQLQSVRNWLSWM